MNTRRKYWLLIAALVATMALTACGNNDGAQPNTGQENSQNGDTSTNSGNAGTNDNVGAEDQAPVTLQGTGSYVGQIDSHSIEINGPDGPAAYQLGEGVDDSLAELNEGDSVQFDYYEQAVEGDDSLKQYFITRIEKADAAGGGADGSTGSEGSKLDTLPETKKIAVEVEGMSEEREAKLVKGAGYGLYMFEQFSFDPAANKLSMNIDPEYYVEIVKLPSDYNLDNLRSEAEAELKPVGDIREMKDEELHKSMQGSALFLIASGDKLTKQYIVKEIDGNGYVFKVNMPHREASEGFGPLAFASINSIVNE